MTDSPPDENAPLPPNGEESVRSVAEAESDAGSPTEEIVRHGGTFESFRHRAYALFWSGALVSNVGTWMQTAVIASITWTFRRSELDLGIVTFVSQIPSLFLALPGGVIADRFDKRKIIIWAQVLLMFQAIAFGVLYVTGRLSPATPILSLALVSSLGLIAGVLTALSFPAWQAILPDLVPRPALAGTVAGTGDVFWINAISFLFVIGAVWSARTSPHATQRLQAPPGESAWTSLKQGVRYAVSHRLIGIVILSTFIMTFVGMPYVFLMPAVADKVLGFHGAAASTPIYYVLLAANGLGALFGALTVASLPHTVQRERLMRWSILATAIVLVAFAFTPWLWLSVALSTIAGACVLTTNSLANTSVQANVPHRLRGRVMSVYITCFLGVMPLSAAAFGPLAQAIGTSWAIAAGALALMTWAFVLVARPALLTPDAPEEA
jgi:MFS family permease